MIDAARSPRPAWQRMATIVALAVLILLTLLFISKKALHHGSQGNSAPPPAAATAPAKLSKPAVSHAAIPGSVAISNRNPFQG